MGRLEDVGMLGAMFAEWDVVELGAIYDACRGNMELSADAILTAGTPENWRAQQAEARQREEQARSAAPQQQQQQQYQAPPGHTAVQVTVPAGCGTGYQLAITHQGRQFMVTVPPGCGPGSAFIATLSNEPPPLQPPQAQTPVQPTELGRGRRTNLPDNFLRAPGYVASPGASQAPVGERFGTSGADSMPAPAETASRARSGSATKTASKAAFNVKRRLSAFKRSLKGNKYDNVATAMPADDDEEGQFTAGQSPLHR